MLPLWLLAVTLLVGTPLPAGAAPVSSSTFTLTATSSQPLCDSQETTTTAGETPTTVGTPCEPTDLTASQGVYVLVVLGAALLFCVFFLLGLSLWR